MKKEVTPVLFPVISFQLNMMDEYADPSYINLDNGTRIFCCRLHSRSMTRARIEFQENNTKKLSPGRRVRKAPVRPPPGQVYHVTGVSSSPLYPWYTL